MSVVPHLYEGSVPDLCVQSGHVGGQVHIQQKVALTAEGNRRQWARG